MVAVGLVAALLSASAASAAPDPVKENLRRLKERLKAAKAQAAAKAAPKPAPKSTTPTTAVRRPPIRYTRPSNSRPQVSSSRPFVPNMPNLKYKFRVETERLGTIPKTGDIVVETTNRGQIVYAYWRVELISGPDGLGRKKDIAPGKYLVMLKGPTLPRPWVVFATVKPDLVTVVEVALPPES